MLDKLLDTLYGTSFDDVLTFICFVFAPLYIVGHIVAFIIRGV
jgi:hypothetical protein